LAPIIGETYIRPWKSPVKDPRKGIRQRQAAFALSWIQGRVVKSEEVIRDDSSAIYAINFMGLSIQQFHDVESLHRRLLQPSNELQMHQDSWRPFYG
jgi:hypothetical protein